MRKKLLFLFLVLFTGATVQADSLNNQLVDAVVAGDIRTVEATLKNGANPNHKTGTIDETPLTLAALNGRAKITEILLKNKADVNVRTKNGLTSLMFAASGGITGALKPSFDQPDYARVIKVLLAHGADPKVKNDKGQTALQIAQDARKKTEIINLLK